MASHLNKLLAQLRAASKRFSVEKMLEVDQSPFANAAVHQHFSAEACGLVQPAVADARGLLLDEAEYPSRMQGEAAQQQSWTLTRMVARSTCAHDWVKWGSGLTARGVDGCDGRGVVGSGAEARGGADQRRGGVQAAAAHGFQLGLYACARFCQHQLFSDLHVRFMLMHKMRSEVPMHCCQRACSIGRFTHEAAFKQDGNPLIWHAVEAARCCLQLSESRPACGGSCMRPSVSPSGVPPPWWHPPAAPQHSWHEPLPPCSMRTPPLHENAQYMPGSSKSRMLVLCHHWDEHTPCWPETSFQPFLIRCDELSSRQALEAVGKCSS